MTEFGEELIKALGEVVAHAEGNGTGYRVHHPIDPGEIRKTAKLTQEQMAYLMGMSASGYRKWEQKQRTVSGPAEVLLKVMAREPEAFRHPEQRRPSHWQICQPTHHKGMNFFKQERK